MSAEPQPRSRGVPASATRRRRAARRQAIEILYQADVTGRAPSLVAEEWRSLGRTIAPYANELLEGVEANRRAIDRLLSESTEGWAVYRMAAVDRTVLRVACEEIRSGVPAAVAINEAVAAANQLSTEASGRFVNGVLGRIARRGETRGGGGPERGEGATED
jgi:transcription antitermination protein NusB